MHDTTYRHPKQNPESQKTRSRNDMAGHPSTIALWGLLTIVFLAANSVLAYEFAGGTGEPNAPFQIITPEQLASIGADPNLLDKCFVLEADIDLDPNSPNGQVFDRAVIAPDLDDSLPEFQGVAFTGSLEGQGHSITGLAIDSDSEYAGLFGLIGLQGSVRRIRMVEGSVRGAAAVPTRCGTGSVAGENQGVIVGCESNVAVLGIDNLGGLVGENRGIILGCHSSGSVGPASAYRSAHFVGGLVGLNSGIVCNSYCTGTIAGDAQVGGLVGQNDGGTISNCYSAGLVSSTRKWSEWLTGGLVGAALNEGAISNCFWNIEASAQEETSGQGTGLTSLQMQDPNTFVEAGWDLAGERENGISDVWLAPEDGGYLTLNVIDVNEFPLPDGNGIPEDPFVIESAEDLGRVWYNPTANYQLANDLDLSGIVWSTAVIPGFTGQFDGQGHHISHLSISGGGLLGLFGSLEQGSTVSNLGLQDVNIVGTDSNIGGLAGENNSGAILNSYVSGEIYGTTHVGGFVGYNISGNISGCFSTGSASGTEKVGGLVGYSYSGTISDCYSQASFSGEDDFGGLVGYVYSGAVSRCYSTGLVIGIPFLPYTGLTGFRNAGTDLSNCFWDIETSRVPDRYYNWDKQEGKTTAQMQNPATYLHTDWDFAETWQLCPGDYPRLQWQGTCEGL